MDANYSNTLKKLSNWIDKVNKIFGGLLVVEALVVLVIGIASNNLYHDLYAPVFKWILVGSALFYLAIILAKYILEKSTPGLIVEELDAKYRLESIQEDLDRVVKVNGFISETISKISALDPKLAFGKKEYTKDTDLVVFVKNELRDFTSCFTSNLDILFSSRHKKYTVGVFFDIGKKISDTVKFPSFYLIRDDLGLEEELPTRIEPDEMTSGLSFDFITFIRSTINHDRYECNSFRNQKSPLIMVSNSFLVQRSFINQRGVLFVVTDQEPESIPYDFESVFNIFTNLLAHWVEVFMISSGSEALKGLWTAITDAFSTKKKKEASEEVEGTELKPKENDATESD